MSSRTSRTRRIDAEDALSIDYYPEGRPTPEPLAVMKLKMLASLRGQLHHAEAHLAAGREWVDGASQSYAVASLRQQIATWESR
jgi:hypothetical protein